MRAPRLEAVWFGDRPEWQRMAEVCESSARRHNPGWTVNVANVRPPEMHSALGVPSHVHNTQKMAEWARIIRESEDGDRVLVIDADTLITGPLDDIWSDRFDVAYTTKASRFPFNSGVVFVRVNRRSRQFFDAWEAENRRLLVDGTSHRPWRQKYGGINQAALGKMIDTNEVGARLHGVPCHIWNCEDACWSLFTEETRIVHFKSALRRATFGRERSPRPYLYPLVDLWMQAERDAHAARRESA